MVCVLLLPYSLVRWGSGREIGIGLAIILVALVMGLVSDFTGVRRSGRRQHVPAVPGDARRRGPLLGDVPDRASWTRCGSGSASSWPVNCTTRSLIMSRPSPIRAQAGRVVAASRPRGRAGCARRDRGGGLAYSRRDAHHGRRSARRRITRAGSAARRGRPRAARPQRRRPAAGRAASCRATSTTSGQRSVRRSTASRRSRSRTPYGMHATQPGSTSASPVTPTAFA